jgi:hypothetical protein
MRSFWRVCSPGANRYLCRKKGRLKLGLFWVCFFGPEGKFYFHNPLEYISLRSFWAFNKIGFVYSDLEIIFFSVILCYN